MKNISVIIPSYNSLHTIEKTLYSLQAQTQKNLLAEIIIVDSSDDTEMKTYLNSLASPDIHIIHAGIKVMPALARNAGAKQAKGDILAFIDSDAMAADDWLEKIMKHYDQGCRVGGGSIAIPEDQRKKIIPLADYFIEFNEFLDVPPPRNKSLVPSVNLFCEKKLFEESGGFPALRAAEDTLFGLRMNQISPLWFIPEIRVFHIFREDLGKFLRNQTLIGKYAIIYRKLHYNVIIYKNILPVLLLPVFLVIKFLRIVFRIGKAGKKYYGAFLYSLPVFLAGMAAWGIGFFQGCLQKKTMEANE